MDDLKQYSKAIMVVLAAILTPILASVGITMDSSLQESIALLVLAALVYVVPNRQTKQ